MRRLFYLIFFTKFCRVNVNFPSYRFLCCVSFRPASPGRLSSLQTHGSLMAVGHFFTSRFFTLRARISVLSVIVCFFIEEARVSKMKNYLLNGVWFNQFRRPLLLGHCPSLFWEHAIAVCKALSTHAFPGFASICHVHHRDCLLQEQIIQRHARPEHREFSQIFTRE